MTTPRRETPISTAEAAYLALQAFSTMVFRQDEEDDPYLFEILEEFLRGIRDWAMQDDGSGAEWSAPDFHWEMVDLLERLESRRPEAAS